MDLERLSGFVKKYTPNGLPFEWEQIPQDADMSALIAWYAWANELTRQDLLDFRKMLHEAGNSCFVTTAHGLERPFLNSIGIPMVLWSRAASKPMTA